jgi:hypothetical protein
VELPQSAAEQVPAVAPELAEAFARDGVVCVRAVLDADELADAARPG